MSRSTSAEQSAKGDPGNRKAGQSPKLQSDDTAGTTHADGSRVVTPENDHASGQAPPEDIDGGPVSPATTVGDKGGTG